MQPSETYQLAITIINVIVLTGLPYWLVWHLAQIKKNKHFSHDWWMQIIITLLYGLAITNEIPALWSRLLAYYQYKMNIPDTLYILTAWDRWNRLFFYIMFYFFTWSFTNKRVPQVLKDALS